MDRRSMSRVAFCLCLGGCDDPSVADIEINDAGASQDAAVEVLGEDVGAAAGDSDAGARVWFPDVVPTPSEGAFWDVMEIRRTGQAEESQGYRIALISRETVDGIEGWATKYSKLWSRNATANGSYGSYSHIAFTDGTIRVRQSPAVANKGPRWITVFSERSLWTEGTFFQLADEPRTFAARKSAMNLSFVTEEETVAASQSTSSTGDIECYYEIGMCFGTTSSWASSDVGYYKAGVGFYGHLSQISGQPTREIAVLRSSMRGPAPECGASQGDPDGRACCEQLLPSEACP